MQNKIEKGVNIMYERCNHFFITIDDLDNFEFVILSSIKNEYVNMLNCKEYNNPNYNYFIGLKENSDKLTHGVYSMNSYKCIYEEPLLLDYNTENKHGIHMLEDKKNERIQNSVSKYSDYISGTWFDFNKLYNEIWNISLNTLNKNTFKSDVSFWDDGTYEITMYDKNLSKNHKKIIDKHMITTNNEKIKSEIYDKTSILCEYHWKKEKCILKIYIKKVSDNIKKHIHIIDEFDVYTHFHYIDSIAKSKYIFDFSKTH